MRHILCYGDSNTWGYTPGSGERHAPDVRWTGVLRRLLGEGWEVLEEGMNGRTTVFEDPVEEGLSALPYLYPCLKSHAPVDLLVVMLGSNDTKERLNANACAIGKGLTRLVRKAQSIDCWGEKGPNILLIAPLAIGKGVASKEDVPQFAEYARKLGGMLASSLDAQYDALREQFESIKDGSLVVDPNYPVDANNMDDAGSLELPNLTITVI